MMSEKDVAERVGQHLGFDFGPSRRQLGAWGQVDRCLELKTNVWMLLEVEGSQHHPNTNVLKLWPFLEERSELTVLLIHVFEKTGKNQSSTRGRLAAWLAEQMTRLLQPRFYYHRLIINAITGEVEGGHDLKSKIASL